MDVLFNMVGISGMVCFLTAYFLLQKDVYRHDSYGYLWLNLLGAVLILTSLMWDWNLPAFLLEAAWLVITTYGLFKRIKKDKATP